MNTERLNLSQEIILQERLKRLEKIVEVLRNLGIKINTRFISENFLKNNEPDFPISSEGMDGIRISIDPEKGPVVWFTNGFEDEENSRRKEIETALQEVGLHN